MKKKSLFVIVLLLLITMMFTSCSLLIQNESNTYTIKVGEIMRLTSSEADDYSSSDETILAVSDDGLVTGISVGKAEVIVTNQTASQIINFVVEPADGAYITVTGRQNLTIGQTIPLTVEVYNNGTVNTLTCTALDQTIASITIEDNIINITANNGGMTIVTITASGNEVIQKDIPIYVYSQISSSVIESTKYEIDGTLDLTAISEVTTKIIDDNKNAVVGVSNYQTVRTSFYPPVSSLERMSIGTGVIYSKEEVSGGYKYRLLTNYHVIEDAEKVKIYFGYEDIEVDAEIIKSDASKDIAVLEVTSSLDINVATLAASNSVVVGEFVIALGNANGYEFYGSATFGMVSYVDRTLSDETAIYVQHDAAINPGNSGGPLFNMKGEVIGLNTIKLVTSEIENMGFAISMSDVHTFLDSIK